MDPAYALLPAVNPVRLSVAADRTASGREGERASALFLYSSDPFSVHQIGRDFSAASAVRSPSRSPANSSRSPLLPLAILDITEHCEGTKEEEICLHPTDRGCLGSEGRSATLKRIKPSGRRCIRSARVSENFRERKESGWRSPGEGVSE